MEAIVKSCLLTTETINHVTSLIPQSPITLFTTVMPPACFPNKYCRKHWRRVQHISNKFWSRWRKEVLLDLQTKTKWNNPARNCKVGNIVLLKNEAEWSQWAIVEIVATTSDDKGEFLV